MCSAAGAETGMKIITTHITLDELQTMAGNGFGDMIKAVVDVVRDILAVDAELHADLETLLLQDGSQQADLWGINLYPAESGDNFIEFDSLINIRPSQANKTRGVEDIEVREKIMKIVSRSVKA